MKKPIYLFGAGGLGREVSSMIMALPEWDLSGFYDDGLKKGDLIFGKPVLGGMNELVNTRESISLVITVGGPRLKQEIFRKLSRNFHIEFPVLIHPGAIIQNPQRVRLGAGTIISAGCILTTDIDIGSHVLLNLNCTVGHDTKVGDCTSVMPGVNLAGQVTIGKSVLIGSGAQVINRVNVADDARVGAGAVVLHDVKSHSTVVGVPAKEIHSK